MSSMTHSAIISLWYHTNYDWSLCPGSSGKFWVHFWNNHTWIFTSECQPIPKHHLSTFLQVWPQNVLDFNDFCLHFTPFSCWTSRVMVTMIVVGGERDMDMWWTGGGKKGKWCHPIWRTEREVSPLHHMTKARPPPTTDNHACYEKKWSDKTSIKITTSVNTCNKRTREYN